MSNPLQRQPELFDNTRRLAGDVAAKSIPRRYQKILAVLRRQPSALFEVAAELGLHDHQISGRFSEMRADQLITTTGERRRKPETGCLAEVWKIKE